MKVLLFNDTDYTWKRHSASHGPAEIPPRMGVTIDLYGSQEFVFVKVWNGVFLVRGVKDEHFASDVGRAIYWDLD